MPFLTCAGAAQCQPQRLYIGYRIFGQVINSIWSHKSTKDSSLDMSSDLAALQDKLDDELLSQDKSSKLWVVVNVVPRVSLSWMKRNTGNKVALSYGWAPPGGEIKCKLCRACYVTLFNDNLVLKRVLPCCARFSYLCLTNSSGSGVQRVTAAALLLINKL